MTAKPHAALIVVGHGSTQNPDSSAPTYAHAERIRAMGVFAEVVCCFWKEEPNMREVFEMVESDTIYVVPNFISEGYFCQEVLPRELRLSGPVTRRDGKTIYYCDPVGIHANMKHLLLQRADEIAPGVPRAETSLVIVGHGTSLNENSTKAIQDQVRLIGEGGYGFAEVVDAYMEQAPLVAEWDQLTRAANVVVVPFFIADGLHSYQDIPVLLGIMEEIGAALSEGGSFGGNPHALRGRQLYYSNAIGTESLMAEVILDQVQDFDGRHGVECGAVEGNVGVLDAWLSERLADAALQMGEVVIERREGGFEVRHWLDREENVADLETVEGVEGARRVSWHTQEGAFRPLHSAPSMKRGWCWRGSEVGELRAALDAIYPAAVGAAWAESRGQLQGTPLRSYLGRQTGMYRFTNGITDDQARQMMRDVCGAGKCMRKIFYPLQAGEELMDAGEGRVPEANGCGSRLDLFCLEPCPFIVGAARKLARENFEKKTG